MKEVDISTIDKMKIVKEMKENTKRQLYAIQIQHEAAELTKNEQAKTDLTKSMESAIQIIKLCDDKLKELEQLLEHEIIH